MTTLPVGDHMATSDALGRQERLTANIRALRVPRAGFSVSDRWMLYIGGTLLPLGLVLVILGWQGASHTVLTFEQIPYLISGGLLGLALVFAGGFVYFAYWMTLMVRENRLMRADLVSVLGRMELLMQETALPVAAPRRVAGPRAPAAATTVVAPDLVATKTGTMIHRADCVAVQNRDNLRPVSATTKGLTPCALCDPLATEA
ncbi:MAG: hypothetical protein JWO12_3581 [Frankiales bacterium]|jgi:hypothetical protein|nr:hypothetical protein [Frankiales bacterium]